MSSVIPQPENSFAHAITDLTGRFISVDDSFCALLHRERQEVLDRTILDLTGEEYRPLNAEKLDMLRASGTSFSIRKTYILGNGQTQLVENVVSLLSNGVGQSVLAATVRPMLSRPGAELAAAMKVARLLLRERNARETADLDCRENDLALMLGAYVLETEGAPAWAANLSDVAGGDRRSNLLRIWELVHNGTLVVDGKAVTLEKASVRLSATNLALIERHLAKLTAD